MGNSILNFSNFKALFEGGAAIKTSRRIREDEFPGTLLSIKEKLFPLLGIDQSRINDQYVIIGSIGKKENPDDTSGDLDIGYDAKWYSDTNGITKKECSGFIYDKIRNDLGDIIGFQPEINYLKGLNIVSIGWPIDGNMDKGIVQLDLIPLSDMKWADFIYYSPNYKIGESKYKSAHRNWLLAAILSSRKEIMEIDDAGEVLDYNTPVLILSDGLYWHTKSYRGKIKDRLKNPKKIEGSERFVTNDPQEFVNFALGPGYNIDDVKTFEQLFSVIMSPDFELKDKLPEIKERFLEFLQRVGLEIPTEINRIQ
jgi:hypothetical protein